MIEEIYLLERLIKIFEKYDILIGLESAMNFEGLNYSEVHTLDLIGSVEEVNGILLSKKMNMTKGALSKITKKLLEKGLIESYKKLGNKKELYFKLSESGVIIYEKHRRIHEEGIARDKELFSSFSQDERTVILKFMDKTIKDIDLKIDSISK
ncbi:MAG: MarR family transcriptional regulator [Proteocatella sp.]